MARFHATSAGDISFTVEEELEADQREAEYLASLLVIKVPAEIRMAQCRAQLIIDGKDDDVELLMASIADPIQQKLYRAYFEYEPIVKRDNAMINEMAPALSIDLDTFFINASKL